MANPNIHLECLHKNDNDFYLYTDGTRKLNDAKECIKVGAGFVIVKGDTTLMEKSYGSSNPDTCSGWNVGGEILAVYKGLKRIRSSFDEKEINVVHDYTGVADWAENRWKIKPKSMQIVKDYKRLYDEMIAEGYTINFIKIKSHEMIVNRAGTYNAVADRLAEDGLLYDDKN